jgi:tetratricopeptide (TPR) repeat protein
MREMKTSTELKKSFLLLVIVAMSGLSAIAQDAAKVAQDAEIKKAIRFMDIEQKSKAIETLNQAIATHPTATRLYYYLGYVQLKTGDKGAALKTFEKGVAANPNEAINHVGLGAIRMAEGKVAEAKPFFDKALSLSKSKDLGVLQAIGEAHLVDVKHAETALKSLEKAKSLDPNNARTHMLMAEADLLQNKGGPSISNSEKAARLDPTNGKPWYDVALVYQRSQNFPLAEENFQKAVSVDPEFTLAYKELGELYYSTKAGEKAAKAYESYINLKENPTDQDKLRFAFFLFMAKNYSKAIEIFKPLTEKPDASVNTLKYNFYALVESGNLTDAPNAFDKYKKVAGENIEASDYKYLGDLFVKLKQDSLAINAYQTSLGLNQDQADVQQSVAEMLFKAKRFPESVAAYRTLLKLRKKPLSLDFYGIGRAYYYNNQFAEADTAFQKLVEMQPARTIGYLWLGNTKANLDPDAKEDGAKNTFTKLIEIAAPAPDAGTNKKDLITAYMYMGFYSSQHDNLNDAKAYMEKVLALDPNHVQASQTLKLIKEGQKPPAQKQPKK